MRAQMNLRKRRHSCRNLQRKIERKIEKFHFYDKLYRAKIFCDGDWIRHALRLCLKKMRMFFARPQGKGKNARDI